MYCLGERGTRCGCTTSRIRRRREGASLVMRYVCKGTLRPATASDQEGDLTIFSITAVVTAPGIERKMRIPKPFEEIKEMFQTYSIDCGSPGVDDGGEYHFIRDQIWLVDEDEVDDDDLDLLLAAAAITRERDRDRKLVRARMVVAMDGEQVGPDKQKARVPIPDDVKIFVWQRDGGQCLRCEARADLEYDHIIPLALGGANTARNLQLLCGFCNRVKGANLV